MVGRLAVGRHATGPDTAACVRPGEQPAVAWWQSSTWRGSSRWDRPPRRVRWQTAG